MLRHGFGPERQFEPFVPFLERATVTPDRLDDVADTAIAAAHDSLHLRGFGVVPLHLNAMHATRGIPEQVDLPLEFFDSVLTEPLERGERLWNEPTH
ncbi:unannotated protein [freshwater metagenome]|uniref:Unannotated protein n=1 Tax=freshwater metagenome TaxID=449393 RepID=A0A6J7K9H0_9ZZZZ